MLMTPIRLLADYGALVVLAALAISFMAYYLFRIWPDERKYRRDTDKLIFEQVALSRQALETSNMVIAQNSQVMTMSAESHSRLGERMEKVEDAVCDTGNQVNENTLALVRIETKLG